MDGFDIDQYSNDTLSKMLIVQPAAAGEHQQQQQPYNDHTYKLPSEDFIEQVHALLSKS